VYRQYDSSGYIGMDVLACEDEAIEGKALLREVMSNGHRGCCSPSLAAVRQYCAEQLSELPLSLRTLEKVLQTPVKVSHRQHELAAEVGRAEH
jgi:hypothetical protein